MIYNWLLISVLTHEIYNSVVSRAISVQILRKVIYNDSYLSTNIEKNYSCVSVDMEMHNKEKPYKFEYCGKAFSNQSYLSDHIEIVI